MEIQRKTSVPQGAAAKTVTVTPAGNDGEAGGVSYTLRVPTGRDKIEIRALAYSEGLEYPSDQQMWDTIRADLVANVEQPEALLEILDEVDAHRARVADQGRKKAGDLDPVIAEASKQIEADMREHCAEYRDLVAQRIRFMGLYPRIQIRSLLIAWSGRAEPLRRENGVVSEETIDTISDDHQRVLAEKCQELMVLGEEQVKNSASPSGSSASRGSSTAVRKRRTAARGKSAGKSTK